MAGGIGFRLGVGIGVLPRYGAVQSVHELLAVLSTSILWYPPSLFTIKDQSCTYLSTTLVLLTFWVTGSNRTSTCFDPKPEE